MAKTPKVTLLTWTDYPLETVYSVWWASKDENPLLTPQQVHDNVDPDEVRKLFRAVIAQKIPIGEHIDFVFMLENISVSWREQSVRHRIGTLASPERLGADIVHLDVLPDLANSSWWSQSMRIQNMGAFADNEAYRVPESLRGVLIQSGPLAGETAEGLYRDAMEHAQDAYRALVESGVPMEDARELIPLGAQHRMSWKLNVGSLQHIVGKRGCWILQLGIWGPIITGMIEELATKVDPIFRELVAPPCIKIEADGNDKFVGCAFHEECRRRLTGDDKLPPCPLHLAHHVVSEDQRRVLPLIAADPSGPLRDLPMRREMLQRIPDYVQFWGRDCYTGERVR